MNSVRAYVRIIVGIAVVLAFVWFSVRPLQNDGDPKVEPSLVGDTPAAEVEPDLSFVELGEALDTATVPPVPESVAVPTTVPASPSTPSKPQDTTPPFPPAPSAPEPQVVFAHTEVVLGAPYAVGLKSPNNVIAVVTLMRGDEEVEVVQSCHDVPVPGGVTTYCVWEKQSLEGYKAYDKQYALRVKMLNAYGSTVADLQSAPFRFAPRSSVQLVPHEDTEFGWSVHYPNDWVFVEKDAVTVFAVSKSGLLAPEALYDAFQVEYCLMSRESCIERVEQFGGSAATIGGKRSVMRVETVPAGYARVDMLLVEGRALFVTRRVLDRAGTPASPFTALALASFDLQTALVRAESYEYDAPFFSGTLLIEYGRGDVSYVRLLTATQGCVSEYDTGTFMDADAHSFRFKTGSCVVKGTIGGDGITIVEEDDCESFHTGACEFEGEYLLRDW